MACAYPCASGCTYPLLYFLRVQPTVGTFSFPCVVYCWESVKLLLHGIVFRRGQKQANKKVSFQPQTNTIMFCSGPKFNFTTVTEQQVYVSFSMSFHTDGFPFPPQLFEVFCRVKSWTKPGGSPLLLFGGGSEAVAY